MKYLLLFMLAIFPQKSGYVNDFSGTLSNRGLEQDLARFQKEEGVQLIVVIVPDLGGRTIRDVSQDYFARWQIGHNGRDRGILVLLSVQDKSSYIDLGYGLEDSINE